MGMYRDLCGLMEIQSQEGFIHFMLSQEKISILDCPQTGISGLKFMIQQLHAIQHCCNVKQSHDCDYNASEFHPEKNLCSSTWTELSFIKIATSCAKKRPESLPLVIKASSSKAATTSDSLFQFCGLVEKT